MSEKNNDDQLDWTDLKLFLAVGRNGGLSPAARQTGRSAATLGRKMLTLERSLNCELFLRTDRGYTLTVEGQNLIGKLDDVETRIHALTNHDQKSRKPLVKVSAGTWTTFVLLDRLREIMGQPADIQLRFMSSETKLDIVHREIVIGFRNSRPTEDTLAGRKIAQIDFAPYGCENAPEIWIKVLANTPSARWVDKIANFNFLCEVNTPRNGLDLALAGHGIVLLPTFIGDREKKLRRFGGIIPELSHEQWIVTHQDDRHLPEVRRTIDRMCHALKTHSKKPS